MAQGVQLTTQFVPVPALTSRPSAGTEGAGGQSLNASAGTTFELVQTEDVNAVPPAAAEDSAFVVSVGEDLDASHLPEKNRGGILNTIA